MDKNIQQRIQLAVDELCDGNESEFCRRIGRPPQTIKNIIGGKNTVPGYDLIYDILSSDLGLSPSWLLLGDGDMLSMPTRISPSVSVVGSAQAVFISNWEDMGSVMEKVLSKMNGGK